MGLVIDTLLVCPFANLHDSSIVTSVEINPVITQTISSIISMILILKLIYINTAKSHQSSIRTHIEKS